MVDQGPVGLVPDGRDDRNGASRDRAHRRLLVEAPQVLERAAAAGHDQDVRPRRRSLRSKRVEAVDRRRDLGRRGLALHADRPHDDADRETVLEPMQNVADDRAGGRGDDAHDPRHERNLALARGVEQPLVGELLPPRLEQRHQRAGAGELELLDDDLIARLAGKRREASGRDDLEAFLGLDLHADEGSSPDDRVEPRAGVLQAEVRVTRGMRAAVAGDFPRTRT